MARRYRLSKKEAKRFLESIRSRYPQIPLPGKLVLEVYEDKEHGRIIFVNGTPGFIDIGGRIIPHLRLLLQIGHNWLPSVMVDSGAVKPLLNGADVMRPGIRVFHGEFMRGEVVVVVEEKYGKPIVVGEALLDRAEAEGLAKGRVIRNIHRIGDRYWSIR